MSHNDDNLNREARRHNPAIIAIIVAVVVAIAAFLVFRPGVNEQNEGIATTPPPAGTTTTPAEGTDGATAPVIAPEGAAPAPAGGTTAPAAN